MYNFLDYLEMRTSQKSVATSTLLELRRVVTDMGVDRAHEILDELESLILRTNGRPA